MTLPSLDAIKALFAHNQFLLGGAILGSIAGILAYAKSVPAAIFKWMKNRIIVTMQVDSRNDCYDWLADWLGQYNERKFRFVRPKIKWVIDQERVRERYVPQISFTPAPGNYLVRYKGRFLWVGIYKEDEKMGDLLVGEKREIYISKLGRDKTILQQLLREGHDITHRAELDPVVKIYHPDGGSWSQIDEKQRRRKETLIYDNDLLERVVNDAKKFLARRAWYNTMCIPWRRGYLFYGPPGSGKTSLSLLLASELGTNICVLNLSSMSGDKDLLKAVATMPKGSLLLLEDIDAAYKKREKGKETGITFSGLLNALDGMLASEGRILVMTTNHKELLDPALIRSGRADVHEYVGHATRSQMERMFKRFYPEASADKARAFAQYIPDQQIGMAKIQEFLLSNETPESAEANAASLKPDDQQQESEAQPEASQEPTEAANDEDDDDKSNRNPDFDISVPEGPDISNQQSKKMAMNRLNQKPTAA